MQGGSLRNTSVAISSLVELLCGALWLPGFLHRGGGGDCPKIENLSQGKSRQQIFRYFLSIQGKQAVLPGMGAEQRVLSWDPPQVKPWAKTQGLL